jgi:anti-anti-sigma regulatory factor
METVVLSPVGTDLASRRSAAQLRQNIESVLNSRKKIVFDLSSVESISESYADELFGVLAFKYGIEKFVASILI